MKIKQNEDLKGKIYAEYYNSMKNLKTNGLVSSTFKLYNNKKNPTNLEKYSWLVYIYSIHFST